MQETLVAMDQQDSGVTARLHSFIEGKTPVGKWVQYFTIVLIVFNVVCFLLSTDEAIDKNWHRTFFIVELVSTGIFTLEYLLRFYSVVETIDGEGQRPYEGIVGRLKWMVTDFFSWVDLASILPTYIDFLIPPDLPATQFVRVARLLRIMKMEGRYTETFTLFDDIWRANKKLIATAGFAGATVWLIIAALYYVCERHNERMWHKYPGCWAPGDAAAEQGIKPACLHRFRSIPSSMYFTLLNLFGEFPLIDDQSSLGRVVACFTAIVATMIFGIPCGIFGDAFQGMVEERIEKEKLAKEQAILDGTDVDDEDEDPMSGAEKTPLYTMLHGAADSGAAYQAVTWAIVIIDLVVFCVSTMSNLMHGHMSVILGIIEAASIVFFLADYIARISVAQQFRGVVHYMFSFYGFVDFVCFVPACCNCIAHGNPMAWHSNLVVRALMVLRILKVERFVKGFTKFDDIVRNNASLLSVTGVFAMITWILASSLMWIAERHNPDPDMAQYYQSVPAAMWITLLNLTGESPLCDFTLFGKVVTGSLGIFAAGWFGIPVGLVASEVNVWLDEEVDADDADADGDGDDSSIPINRNEGYGSINVTDGLERPKGFRHRLYMMLEGKTPLGRWLELVIALFILLSVTQAILTTVDWVIASKIVATVFDVFEVVAVAVFTIEYLARLYAAPESTDYNGDTDAISRLKHIVSFYALIDAVAIFPYYVCLVVHSDIDNYLRLLRLLRLLKLDKYAPGVTLIDDVFRVKKRSLLIAAYVALVFWMCFTAALFVAEHNDRQMAGSVSQAWRFSSMTHSLQYDAILLSGDYPLVDFTVMGKLVNIAQIIFAVACIGLPSGIICDGFSTLLDEQRQADRDKRKRAANTMQKAIRSYLARKRFRETVDGAMAARRSPSPPKTGLAKFEAECQLVLTGESMVAKVWRAISLTLIISNIVVVLLESMPEVHAPLFFQIFETVSVVFFTVEYFMRIFGAAASSKFKFSRLKYVTSFYGLVDLATILPFYVEQILKHVPGYSFDGTIFRIFRMLRLFQLENFVDAFKLLDNVWRKCKDTLAATGLLALVIWVLSASLFYVFERHNTKLNDGHAMENIPSAMYYTAIFLAGEWGQVDFTWPGKILCVFLVAVGVALFGIPVGAFFEAFADELSGEEDDDEEEESEANSKDDEAPPPSSAKKVK